MTYNRLFNNCMICVFIFISGLGFALALPLLANSQSLAAHENTEETKSYGKLIISDYVSAETIVKDFGNIPTSENLCFATHNNGSFVFSEPDASAVQDAVDAASAGDTVKVAGTCIGVEARAGLNQTVYISKSLTLEGGHTQSDWTLDPDPDTYTTTLYANNSGRVVVITGTADVTLDSLNLTGGVADDGTLDDDGGGIWSNRGLTLTNSTIYSNTADSSGGGMYNLGVSPVLTNVTFSGNSAGSGGAMYNNGEEDGDSSPILTNVTFSSNSAGSGGGAMYNNGESSPILTNVIFSGNTASSGGAMYNNGEEPGYNDSSPILTNVTFSGNSANYAGGAMYNNAQSNPILTNVIFSGNTADQAGGAMNNNGYYWTSLLLTNVTFSGNSANYAGGAMYNYGITSIELLLTNVTFSGNSATIGGAMYNRMSYYYRGNGVHSKVQNSILWNNFGTGTIASIYNGVNCTSYFMHSLVQGSGGSSNWLPDDPYRKFKDGGGNIDTNPLFILDIDPSTAPTTTGNLRLQTGSPAVNAGNNSFVTVPTDLDGNERIIGCIVDMGAYETIGIPCQIFEPLIFR